MVYNMSFITPVFKRMVFKQAIKNARGLAKSLLKAFNTVQELKSENSYHNNLILALKARPEWHQAKSDAFEFKGETFRIKENKNLEDIVVMVSDAEIRYSGGRIPVDELTTLQMMAREVINNFFREDNA